MLFRNNVVRHIRHANGIWLDIGNANDRLTGNVFADIPGDVNPHAIHIEGSDGLNEIDNNIFSDLTGGILIRDTNNVIIAYNLFLNCKEVCVDTVSGINGPRPDRRPHEQCAQPDGARQCVLRHGPLGNRVQQRQERCRRQRVSGLAGGPMAAFFGQPISAREVSRAGRSGTTCESWREQHGWDMNGATADIAASLDPDTLELTMSVKGNVKALPRI